MNKVLVTCPPMLGCIDSFIGYAREQNIELLPAEVTQTMSEEELVRRLPGVDGWIIGDDPATRRVFEAGRAGKLRAAVKWGVGIDNVDFEACRVLEIPVTNTPMMFGDEVADVALCYVIGLARRLFFVDREVRLRKAWPKPTGTSLSGKTAGVVGLGNIGSNVARRLIACGMNVIGYDPGVGSDASLAGLERAEWPKRLENLDFVVLTCALNKANWHIVDQRAFAKMKHGVYIVNVARGSLIDEPALVAALKSGWVAAAALDVFENEPLAGDSPLRDMPQCVFGSHNASNTLEAVARTSRQAVDQIAKFLNG